MPKKLSLEIKLGIAGDRLFQTYCKYLETYDSWKGKDGPERFFEIYKMQSKAVMQLTEANWDKVWGVFLFLLGERGKGYKKKKVI